MLAHEPTWATVGLFSAGSVALGAIATASIINALNRRGTRSSEPDAKRQKLSPPSPSKPAEQQTDAAGQEQQQESQLELQGQQGPHLAAGSAKDTTEGAPLTPDADATEPHGLPHPDSIVDLQKLQELEQRVADLNALAELGKVYQDSLALSAQLRNLSSFRLQQDKVLGRGSLAVVQEGEYAGDSVAVKLLPIGSVFAEDSRKEACLALCLHHPNIVRVVGVHLVEVEQKPYLALVQETAPGGDLGWQIEDCDFHTGKRGAASMDVAIKLLLDAARGLAYMHDVDVVHGDVKSRNLLVFWEDETSDDEDGTTAAAADNAESAEAAAVNGKKPERERDLVWLLKWCDFGVSFRAAEAPGGVLRTVTGTPGFRAPEVMDEGWSKAADTYAFGVIAWQLLTGEKPIVYDREWRMHVPNPNLLRCDRAGGDEAVPRALVDLVFDCGAYQTKDRPSMREVVNRLEDIAMQRLQKQQAEQAESEAAGAAAAREAQAAEAAKKQQQQEAAAAAEAVQQQQKADAEAAAAAKATADAAAMPPPSAAHAHDVATCPTCQQPKAGFGGLARALSAAAREAAAGGAAADAAAMAHYQSLLQREAAAAAAAVNAAAASAGSTPPAAIGGAKLASIESASHAARHHTYEVLIENDDDPITAEAVAHTLDQYDSGNLSKVFAGHPQALQLLHELQEQHGGAAAGTVLARHGAGRALRYCATAPVHSRLLDAAADAAAAEVAAAATETAQPALTTTSSLAPRLRAGGVPAIGYRHVRGPPSSPISIVGAVSRSSIELLPAPGPGLMQHSTATADAVAGSPVSNGTPPAAAAAAAAAGPSSAPGGGWYLASGSSFKKGMWLEKGPAVPAVGRTAGAQAQAAASDQAAALAGGSSFEGPAGFPLSPLSPPGGGRGLPDAAALLQGSFSLQLRREHSALPAVAEEGQEGAATAGQQHTVMPVVGSLPAGWDSGHAGKGREAGGKGSGAAADATAARMLRRQQTTKRLGTDVLAAAGALSKALSAFSSASQALPAVAPAADGGTSPPAAAGTSLLLTSDFVAAARGLSEALAALLPSAAVLADVAPGQGAAAAAAASEAVAGLKTLQGQMAAAAVAGRAGAGSGKDIGSTAAPGRNCTLADVSKSAGIGSAGNAAAGKADDEVMAGVAAAQAIDIPGSASSRDGSVHSAWAAEATSLDRDDSVQDTAGAILGTRGNNSFSFTSLYDSASYGGSMISRRHSTDGNRPSFGAAAAAGGDASAPGAQDSPVLLRMPSRRKSLEMRQ